MSARRRPRGTAGATGPTALTVDVAEKLIESTRAGIPMRIAAQAAGVSERAFALWMKRGYEEDQRIEAGEPSSESERSCVELYQRVMAARAQAGARNVLLIQKAANGGQVIEETTRKYRDDNGEMVEETTIKRTAVDWRAAAWFLERQQRGEFSKDAMQLEVTGAGGGPLQVDGGGVDEAALAAKITANLAAIAAAIAPAAAIEAARHDEIVIDEADIDEDGDTSPELLAAAGRQP